MRWSAENGCWLDADTCASAAQGGQLQVLQWLRGYGCPWDTGTCRWAVDEGKSLEVLRWARENGCPWEPGTKMKAASTLGYTDNFGNLAIGDLVLNGLDGLYNSMLNNGTFL